MDNEQLIRAAEAHAAAYDGDDRECIMTDVLNAFYAGAKFGEAQARRDARVEQNSRNSASPMTHHDIGDAVRRHERERHEERARRMHEYDENVYRPAMRALREQCGAIGHHWRFRNVGPLGDPWFSCTSAGRRSAGGKKRYSCTR